MKKLLLVLVSFLVMIQSAAALQGANDWYTYQPDKNQLTIAVKLFLSTECPHCHKADAFFTELEAQNHWLRVERYFINKDKQALSQFNQLLSAQQMDDFAVPSIYFCDSRWIGFQNAETTGAQVTKAIEYCATQIEASHALDSSTIEFLRKQAMAAYMNSTVTKEPGSWSYLTLVALMDAISPCSLFWYLGLVSMLLLSSHLQRKSMLWVYFCFGFIYQLVYPWNWQAIGLSASMLRILALIAGAIGIAFCYSLWKRKQHILLQTAAAALMSVMVFCYQQTCILSWGTVFQNWLVHQNSNATISKMVYLLFYQIIYAMVPLLSIEIIRRLLKRIEIGDAGFLAPLSVMCVLSFMLIIYPQALSSQQLSQCLFVFCSGLACFLRYKSRWFAK